MFCDMLDERNQLPVRLYACIAVHLKTVFLLEILDRLLRILSKQSVNSQLRTVLVEFGLEP